MTAIRSAIDAAKAGVLRHLGECCFGRTFGHLMLACGLRRDGRVEGLPHRRVLDRALQELRKAGRIRFERQQWWLIGGDAK